MLQRAEERLRKGGKARGGVVAPHQAMVELTRDGVEALRAELAGFRSKSRPDHQEWLAAL